MSEDGLSGDVDVDYRSSKSPQALWNGHLTASNSDIRAGKNYTLHNLRWEGLVNWWLDYFGRVPEYEVQRPDLFVAPPETPTPLPPDRPYGASPALVQDAAQEWLTDWLVRGKIDEAIAFMSAQAKSCLNVDDREGLEQMSLADATAHLQLSMGSLVDVLGLKANLTEAVDAILPWSEVVPVREHEFDGEFTLVEVPDSVAAAFRCEVRSDEGLQDVLENKEFQYGNYFGTMFRLKDDQNRGGILSVLWAKEDGAWKIISWQTVTD